MANHAEEGETMPRVHEEAERVALHAQLRRMKHELSDAQVAAGGLLLFSLFVVGLFVGYLIGEL